MILRDGSQAFVTQLQRKVWRFDAATKSWRAVADAGPGDPALYARSGGLYSTWGALDGRMYDPNRVAIRISAPSSEVPQTEIVTFSESAQGHQHESLWAFDAWGEGRYVGSSVRDLATATSYPWRINGLNATALPPRQQCLFPSVATTSTPGRFAFGCINSTKTGAAGYDFVLEGPSGDVRVNLAASSVRTLNPVGEGLRDIRLDQGDGIQLSNFLATLPKPSLASASKHDTFIALVPQRANFGTNNEHWFLHMHLYYSRNGGRTWTHGGRLCGIEGADCYAGSVVYDEAADRYYLSWLQRGGLSAKPGSFSSFHTVVVGQAAGNLRRGGDGSVILAREEVDAVQYSGIGSALPADHWVNVSAYRNFAAIGYFKDGKTTFAYKQFAPGGPRRSNR